MKNILILFSILTLLTSCLKQECNCPINESIINHNQELVNELLVDENGRAKEILNRFDEQPLHDLNYEVYRFAITVLLYDFKKIYRIENNLSNYRLVTKEYATQTTINYREDSLIRSQIIPLSKSEWLNFKNTLDSNCFWTLDTDISEDDNYLDGSYWILEGSKSNNPCTNMNYHFALRNSPDSSRFLNITEKFMEFDSLNLKSYRQSY